MPKIYTLVAVAIWAIATFTGGVVKPAVAAPTNQTIPPLTAVSLPNIEVEIGEEFGVCLQTTDLMGKEVLSFQGDIQYPTNLEIVSYRLGSVPPSQNFWLFANPQPRSLPFVAYGVNFLEGTGSLICLQFRAVREGEGNLTLVDFMYNEWPQSSVAIQNGTVLVEPWRLFLPLIGAGGVQPPDGD